MPTLSSTNFVPMAAQPRVSSRCSHFTAVRLPGSYPAQVPQPYGYSPVPVQPADDYYVSKRELIRILEERGDADLMYKKPEIPKGTIPVISDDGDITDSGTLLSTLRQTVSDNSASVSKVLEILTSRDDRARVRADELHNMMHDADLESMTQAEKTGFLIKLMEYVIAREGYEH